MFKFKTKSYVATYGILVLFLLFVGVINVIADLVDDVVYDTIAFMIISLYFIAVVFVWIISVRRRVLNQAFRRQYTAIAIYLILILSSKMIKYRFIWDETVERYIWYLWYPLMIFVPLNAFYASMYLGMKEDYHISRKWYFLYIPAAILSIVILFNDIHQLVFKFDSTFTNTLTDYSHGVFYYIAVVWITILFLLVLVNTFIRCSNSKIRKKIYVPIIILCIGGFGFGAIVALETLNLPEIYSFPDFFSLFVVVFLESLIQINLVRTNVGYISFYEKMDVISVITDEELTPVYITQSGARITSEDMARNICGEENTENNLKIHNVELKNGYFFWATDITDIVMLKEKLLDAGISLDDENEMLQAENELSMKRIRIEKQDEIINRINELVKSDVLYVTKQLSKIDKKNYIEKTKKIFIPICYIKRRINMFLISYNEKSLPAKELAYSLNELIEYIKNIGIDGGYSFKDDVVGGYDIIFLFEQIYRVILHYLDCMESIYIHCGFENEANIVRILIDHKKERSYPENGFVSYDREDNTSIITIVGGDSHA